MKLSSSKNTAGFTLSEMVIGLSLSSLILAATLTSTISLQKSFNAVDNYFATHMQQVRIIDYLTRDVNRGLAVTTSADLQSVTVSVPNYLIKSGDPEALVNPSLVGTPRTPVITNTVSGPQVNYTATSATVVYSISGLSIVRIENGVVTTIASSTDQLLPQTTDVELANTEYTNTSITFQPIFTSSGSVASRSGTNISALAYLRNKRRS
jgi:Tfp pilus assembly protein PilW